MSKKLDAILSQYEKNTESKGKSKISNEDRLKKYFTEKLQKGVKSSTKTFRILPGKGEVAQTSFPRHWQCCTRKRFQVMTRC